MTERRECRENEIRIRLASLKDADIVARHDNHISEALIRDKISREEIIVAYDGNTFIGWLRYSLFWDIVPFMNMLLIQPEYRGKGIGRQLAQFWEALMRKQGHKKLMTSTQQNEHAQHFYLALGYVAVGGFIQTSGSLTDESFEIILVKELSL